MNIYFRHSSPFGKGDTAPPISQKCSQKHKKIPKNKIWGKFFILGKNHKIAVTLDFTGFAGSCRFSQKRHIENILCSGAHPIILKGQNPVSSLSSHPTAKPSGTAAQFHSTFRSGNPDNPTSIASHITVSSYTAALSQCHFRSIIQSIPHTLQHQEISTFRSVTHALVVSQQTHAVMFRLLLFYTESC